LAATCSDGAGSAIAAGSYAAGSYAAGSHAAGSRGAGVGGEGSNGTGPDIAAEGAMSAMSASGDLRVGSVEGLPDSTSSAQVCHAAHAAAVLP
jgi:hypothetical protein